MMTPTLETFDILPSRPWAAGIAADWFEERGGCPVKAAAIRAGLWEPSPVFANGNGHGNGHGNGDGYGHGHGNGDGDGHGDGDGDGDGYGNGHGYGHGYGDGHGDGYGS